MKILLAHNFYQQAGGEDQVYAAEQALLRAAGHDVVTYERDNDEIEHRSRLGVAAATVWSGKTLRDLGDVLAEERPDVAHFHNTFPLISPSAYTACRRAGVPVVQTLHNFRVTCCSALLFRKGKVCEECLGRAVPWAGILNRCYRGSLAGSTAVAAMIATHRAAGTWTNHVDTFIALTPFAKNKLVEAGLPAAKITIKPNFLTDVPPVRSGAGESALFVGRLAPEKGIKTLLKAFADAPCPLTIAGVGPLADEVERGAKASTNGDIHTLGWVDHGEMLGLMRESRFLVLPSLWYEGFPMTVVEAMASGVPVVASRIGSLADLVEHEHTGLLVPPGDAKALRAATSRLWNHPDLAIELGTNARRVFEERYSGARNLDQLTEIYTQAGKA